MHRSLCARRVALAAALWASVFREPLGAQSANQDEVLRLVHSGTAAMQHGDLPGAETIFKKVVSVAPTLSDAYLGLGLVELRRGELEDAVRSLAQATDLNPRLPGAHLFLGIAQYQAGKGEVAGASLRAELVVNPENVEALTWLGIVALSSDRPEQAIAPIDHAAALKPNDPRILYYQARAHAMVAKAALAALYQLDPESALVHRATAENLEGSGQTEKAIAEFEAAITKDPANPDLYEELGDADQKMSRMDAARAAYEQELKLNPESAIALYNLGRIEVERGQPANGVALLRRAESAHASVGPTDFYLGLGLAELGQNEEAAQWLERALANHPSAFVQQGAWYQLTRVYPKLNRKADAQNAVQQLKQVLDAQQQEKQATAKAARASSPGLQEAAPPNQP